MEHLIFSPHFSPRFMHDMFSPHINDFVFTEFTVS